MAAVEVETNSNLGVFKTKKGKFGVAYAVLADDHGYFVAYSLGDPDPGTQHVTIHKDDINGWIEPDKWEHLLSEPMRTMIKAVQATYSIEDIPCGYKPCVFR